ncbi:MAG: type II secretion system F family protein, partial [Faecalibacillus sp.]
KKEMKNTLIKKMTYPFCMLIFMFIFSIFIASYLLPQVENLFRDFQIEKSVLIQIVFILFHIIPYFMFLSFLTIIFISIYVYRHVKKIDFKVIDFFIHRTHIISYFLKKYYSLKFAIYYDELLQNKYDVTSIVEILYKKIDDSDIKMIIYELYHMIYNGLSVDDAIRQFDYFEEQFKFFYFMMNHSGGNKKSLKNYIDFVYMQIDLFLSKFVKIVVPLIYGFVASFVIIVYISIILPMMNIITIV